MVLFKYNPDMKQYLFSSFFQRYGRRGAPSCFFFCLLITLVKRGKLTHDQDKSVLGKRSLKVLFLLPFAISKKNDTCVFGEH